ncbi:hypothetical protein [Butyrivibrio sp. WCE2006]|uniref:hypothetical protein n=1 Tax=Butyrivibrio sp. WCE2006 TaxID=1410611 RepID=UPI0005D20E89|nr:hypothetical protein [Butyrivibrio sp. WCE2006]
MKIIRRLTDELHRKLKSAGSKGFSIAEMLFAVLILLLASQLIAESMRLAAAHYIDYTNHAHAQMIMSTLSDFVRSEITTASEIDDSTGDITFIDGSGLIGGRCKIVDGTSIYLESLNNSDKKYYPIVGIEGGSPNDGTEGGSPHDYAEKLEIDAVFEKSEEPTKQDPNWTFELSIEVFDKKGNSLAKGKYEITVPGEVKQ